MADKATPEGKNPDASPPQGDRIAKVLSRRGVASRREAERLIEAGEVRVNGKIIESPALNVTSSDVITISGHPLPVLEPARLWLYYKPDGLVTSANDEKGRDTVFDNLPDDLPRVMSVGRLDLNSEGLLLLTNDGALKRRLELPSTGWLRKYRVRVNGNPTDPDLEPLRTGIVIGGEKFQPMAVVLDRHQGANAWLTVGLREGKNREVRRAMAAIDLTVNRLIRVSYGPFRLGDLKPGQVEEVRAKTLREQLGEGGGQDAPDILDPAARKTRPLSARYPAAKTMAAKTATTSRRPRDGDGVRALARAWDDATAGPKGDLQKRDGRTTRSSSAKGADRATTASRATRDSDTAPRRTGMAKSAPSSGAPSGARQRDEARAPRAGNEEHRPGPRAKSGDSEDRPFKRVTTTSRAERETDAPVRRIVGPKPGVANRTASAGSSRPQQDSSPAPRRIAGPKSGLPKSGPPKSGLRGKSGDKADVQGAGNDRRPVAPRGPKPPTRPRKG